MRSFLFQNPPFPQCHGSTLAQFNNGYFMAAWFAGTREQHNDTAIWGCWQDANNCWTKPEVIAKVSDEPHWNPVLFLDDSGTMWLYFKVGGFPDRWDTWRCKFRGKWSAPRKLESKDLSCGRMTPGPVRGKMVKLSSGTILAPSSIEQILARRFPHSIVRWESVIHRSTDGKKWTPSFVPFPRSEGEYGGIIQPSVWETDEGCAALFRSTNGVLYRSNSTDDGKTWSPALPTSIPNPNSAVDICRKGDVLAMVFNPVSGNWTKRSPISVAFSRPDGLMFSSGIEIEGGEGSFSYPAMIETKEGFAITYTWNRTNIAFANVVVTSVEPGEIAPVVKAEVVEGPKAYEFGLRGLGFKTIIFDESQQK